MTTAIKKRELPKELPMGFRTLKVRGSGDGEARTYPLVLSSDAPVKRSGWFGWYYEVLPHERKAVNTTRLDNGLAMLVNHDPNQRAGVVADYRLGGGKLTGNVRFNTTTFGQQVRQEVDDETLTGASVGYTVDKYERVADVDPDDDEDEDYLGTYRAASWTPYEVSLTPIEADVNSGVGRNADQKFPVRFIGAPEATPIPVLQETRMLEVAVLPNDALKLERERFANINILARQYPEIVTREISEKWIAEGADILATRSFVLEAQRQKQEQINTGGAVQLTEKESRQYDFKKIIRAQSDPKGAYREDCGFEREISMTIAKTLGRDTPGLWVPTDQPVFKLSRKEREQRALYTGSAGAGGNLVATELISFLDVLRPQLNLTRMGANFMGGMTSNFSIPKMLSDTTFNWTADNPGVNNTDVDATFGQVQFTPNQAIASTSISRQLIQQSSIDVEPAIRNGIIERAAIGIETAALQGTGGTQPLGLLSTTGVNLEAIGTNGGVVAYTNLVDMSTKIDVANAAISTESYLLTPEIAGYLATQPELANTIALPIFKYGADGTGKIFGHDAYRSNLLPKNLVKGTSGAVCHALIYGVWSALTVAEFGAMEILVDPYTLARQALVSITANFLVDSNLTYPQAFTACIDAIV
jgi:HK97 family phage major capsid protein